MANQQRKPSGSGSNPGQSEIQMGLTRNPRLWAENGNLIFGNQTFRSGNQLISWLKNQDPQQIEQWGFEFLAAGENAINEVNEVWARVYDHIFWRFEQGAFSGRYTDQAFHQRYHQFTITRKSLRTEASRKESLLKRIRAHLPNEAFYQAYFAHLGQGRVILGHLANLL